MFENHVYSKVVNSVSVDVLFFQLEWNVSVSNVSVLIVSVSKYFGVPFQSCTVHIYIYIQKT